MYPGQGNHNYGRPPVYGQPPSFPPANGYGYNNAPPPPPSYFNGPPAQSSSYGGAPLPPPSQFNRPPGPPPAGVASYNRPPPSSFLPAIVLLPMLHMLHMHRMPHLTPGHQAHHRALLPSNIWATIHTTTLTQTMARHFHSSDQKIYQLSSSHLAKAQI